MIDQLGYPSYFLTVADVVDLIKSLRVRAAARGSGAGSLVTYLLGISDVDPLRYGLLMERFLSPLRHQLPDIDIDVESARRMEVYDAVIDRFGADRVSCISMMDTYRVRHAIRDVGAALGLPPAEIDAVAKAFPHIRANQVHAALKDLPELRASRLGSKRGGGTGDLDLMFDLVARLDGLPRHIALHPCGVLLSDATLLDRTPVESSYLGYPMSQFDKDDVEELGLLKLDLLGIRMQSAIAHALDEVARVDGETVDIDAIPRDDEPTFELIRSTRTLGMFQIESPGQRELVGKFGPQTFEDLIIDISLFRPGPVKSDMVTPFLMARNGWRDAVYPHPDLEFALEETAGVVVFHEQVLQVVARMTGCTLAEADEVRRALGEKDAHPEVRAWFVPRALAAGYPVEVAEQVWTVLAAFGSFGFCKAHAAAFALPTYQSAWLKAHHPAAFLAGVLTHDPGMYPKRLILDDARNFGIRVLGLDVNVSAATYRVERIEPDPDAEVEIEGGPGWRRPDWMPASMRAPSDYGIRLALADVKGINDDEVARVVTGQPYRSLTDFWHRASVSRPVVERLVLAGGFDSLYGFGVRDREVGRATHRRKQVTRRDLLLQIGDLDRWSRSGARASSSGQLSLDLMGLELPEDCAGGDRAQLGGRQRAAGVHRRRAGARRAGGARPGRQPARHRLLQAVPGRHRGGPGGGAAHLPQRRGGAGRRGQGGDPDAADPLRPAGGLRDPGRRHRLHRLDLLRGRPGALRRDGVPLLAAGHPRGAAAHRSARGVAAGHRGVGAAGAARGLGGRRPRRRAGADGGAGGVHRRGDRRGGGVAELPAGHGAAGAGAPDRLPDVALRRHQARRGGRRDRRPPRGVRAAPQALALQPRQLRPLIRLGRTRSGPAPANHRNGCGSTGRAGSTPDRVGIAVEGAAEATTKRSLASAGRGATPGPSWQHDADTGQPTPNRDRRPGRPPASATLLAAAAARSVNWLRTLSRPSAVRTAAHDESLRAPSASTATPPPASPPRPVPSDVPESDRRRHRK